MSGILPDSAKGLPARLHDRKLLVGRDSLEGYLPPRSLRYFIDLIFSVG
jgi:hypothetical protein